MSQQTTQPAQPKSAASKLFDIRILIGGLFTLYGVVLIVAGVLASAAERQKAAGVNINLWMGIGMLVLGLLFLLWWRLQPLRPPAESAEPADAARAGRRSRWAALVHEHSSTYLARIYQHLLSLDYS